MAAKTLKRLARPEGLEPLTCGLGDKSPIIIAVAHLLNFLTVFSSIVSKTCIEHALSELWPPGRHFFSA
tara:strand:+ start:93 stop:299 length:207 start_codon:yes stop_codon:yes gene_type:complete